jgi:hypothetical protein
MNMASGFVHIIESPSDSDLLHGWTEGRTLCEALNIANIPYFYNLAATRKTLEESLGIRLYQAVSHHKRPPIIHLSMHGDNDGVQLMNREFLSWEDLRKLLAPIINPLQGRLLICLSSCYGSSGCKMAMHEDEDYPFWALVGNADSASLADVVVAYTTFYHLFFKDVPVDQCVEGMRVASGNKNFQLFYGPEVKASWASFMTKKRFDDLVAALQRSSSTNTGTLNGLFGQQPGGTPFGQPLRGWASASTPTPWLPNASS